MPNKNWKMKDMIEYAVNKYHLHTGADNADGNLSESKYEKAIRRKLLNAGLVEKDNKTGNYNYELPEENAKYFIDNTMKKYFSDEKKYDDEVAKEQFKKKDKALNEESFENFIDNQDYLSECYANGVDPYAYELVVMQDEIERNITNVMIKAIFSKFFDFDEEQYTKDYRELKYLVNSDDISETYQEGYSYLKNKLDNPVENYCIPKR